MKNNNSEKPMMHVLPVEAYTSEDWFDREQAAIFSKKSPYFQVGATAVSGESPVKAHQQIILDFIQGDQK